MRFFAAWVVFAARVVEHAHVGHATLGSRAVVPLLPDAGGIKADVSRRASLRVALPLPRRLRRESRLVLQQRG